MRLQFNKYQGTGNDFIIIDNRSGLISLSDEQVKFLCDRKFGIGSDGLILLEKSEKLDFDMNFYNPDASRSFCGNGSRCIVRFAADLGLIGASGGFSAIDGEHEFAIDQNHIVIHMSDVTGITRENDDFVINTGSPHYLRFVNDVDGVDILPESRAIRYGYKYRVQGINVNFIEPTDSGIRMRTYERGVEAETLSCGTGVTAAALSFAYLNPDRHTIQVSTRGGLLDVKYTQQAKDSFTNIWLSGPAQFVFKGEIDL